MSSDPLLIRAMQVEDLEQVHEIDQLSFSLPWPMNSYRFELHQNPSSRCWVAELMPAGEGKKVVGLAVVWLILDEGHLATFAVHPNYRRLGIGKRLLSFTLQNAKESGIRQVTLEVRETNQVAQSLYSQFGFVVVSRRPHYYQDTHEDALLMTVQLKSRARPPDSILPHQRYPRSLN